MELTQSNFRDWTLERIDEVFGLKQVFQTTLLDELLSYSIEISDYEEQYIKSLQAHFLLRGDDWNEVELENKFISTLIVFSSKPSERYSYFLERDLSVEVDNYILSD